MEKGKASPSNLPEGKVYSYQGRPFRIHNGVKAAVGGIPYFSSDEWAWIKGQNLTADQFKLLCTGRVDDPRWPVIIEEVATGPGTLAQRYTRAIMEQLRGRGAKTREEKIEEQEKAVGIERGLPPEKD